MYNYPSVVSSTIISAKPAIRPSVAGRALIVGTADGGSSLRDVATDMDSLRGRIKYL